MTGRDRWDLRGPVRTCRLERTWYVRRRGADACETEERTNTTLVEFLADGSLARQWHRNPDGSELAVIYAYDSAGRLATVRGPSEAAYEYDAAGRLARVIARAADGSERLSESYEYDAQGRTTKTVHVDPAGPRTDAWGVEGTDTSYSAQGTATLTSLYNERDQPAQVVFRDAEGRLLNRVEFVYDDAGRLIEEAQTKPEDALPADLRTRMNPAQREAVGAFFGIDRPTRRLHRYDERGRRTETTTSFGPLGGNRLTVAFNDHGDPVAHNTEFLMREHGIDEEGRLSDTSTKEVVRRSEARFLYDYDAGGNWIAQVVEARAGADQSFTFLRRERRTIVYLD